MEDFVVQLKTEVVQRQSVGIPADESGRVKDTAELAYDNSSVNVWAYA